MPLPWCTLRPPPHSAPAMLKSNFLRRLNSSSSGSSFVQQKSNVIAISGERAREIFSVRHAISIPAFEGSDQSTSKKLLPSPGIAATLVIKMHAERANAAKEDRVSTMTARIVQVEP
eukprot:CAMPEP_0172710644 /NCGR_PEP_ID=MMETSP1074-20121228/56235_1 /TAXON_ID=2916 /ORGANISM="Ceratium fusus, Strain PA161109" /LENGTH=116 /DNA_ID=CAMNT_0013534101 /DNA_START=41 /DNA_END=391 /DNA_ORIENTATION=+